MSLNIKNEETVRLVRELAGALDVSMTAAITDAVRARLAEIRAETPRPAFDVNEVLALLGEIGDRLGKEYLDQDFDALLYDEKGLPK
jgi:antitoxin VapB